METWTQMQQELRIQTHGRGFHDITESIVRAVGQAGISTGLCTIFIKHTSASLTIQEGADPDARSDLERFFERLVPDGDPEYTHTAEGPDDMPSHIRSALTDTTLSIPVTNGRPSLGTWQHLFLCEHRQRGSQRSVVLHVVGTRE